MTEDKPSYELKEITVSVSGGAKVQIVQYQFTCDHHFSMTEKYEVKNMTEAEAHSFKEDRANKLQKHIDEKNQEAIDELTELRDNLRENG